MQRGAAFLCQIASTESHRPVGLFINLAWVKSQMLPGWPRLHKVDRQLFYDGPLRARCSCSTPHAPMRHGWTRRLSIPASLQDSANNFGSLAHPLLFRTKDMCPLGLEDFPARVLLTLRPSLLASHPSHSLAGLVLPSPCTTYGPVVYFLAVSLLTLPVSRPQRSSSDLGGTAIILVAAALLRLALFLALRSWLAKTQIWRGQVHLQRFPDLRTRPW